MKSKRLYILIFLVFLASNAMAFDWKGAGFEETGNGTSDEGNYLIFKDNNSVTVKIRYQGELVDSWAEKIVDINAKFSQWKYMKPDNIEYFVTGESLEILVVPSSFKFKEYDFMTYLPAGMTFIYDYTLRYNFRITKNDVFLRLNDKFIDEDSLCNRMKEGLDDPIGYLKKREPEFFLQKLNELEEKQDRLTKALMYYQNSGFLGFGNTPVKSIVVKRVVELKTADPKINFDTIKDTLDKEKIDASAKEIKLVLSVLYNEFN